MELNSRILDRRALTPVQRLIKDGYIFWRLDTRQVNALVEVYETAEDFFNLSPKAKLRYSVDDRTAGYRPFGYAFADAPDRPDLNDSYIHWNEKRDGPTHANEIPAFVGALEAWRQETSQIVATVLDDLRAYYNCKDTPGFDDFSILQVNSYNQNRYEELLQQSHDDGTFLTVISVSSPGLEAVRDGVAMPIVIAPDEVLVMPGSVMADMTGGEIPPFVHQARNHGDTKRKSVMYFATFDTYAPIEPFAHTDANREVDIRDRIIGTSLRFGFDEDMYRPD